MCDRALQTHINPGPPFQAGCPRRLQTGLSSGTQHHQPDTRSHLNHVVFLSRIRHPIMRQALLEAENVLSRPMLMQVIRRFRASQEAVRIVFMADLTSLQTVGFALASLWSPAVSHKPRWFRTNPIHLSTTELVYEDNECRIE